MDNTNKLESFYKDNEVIFQNNIIRNFLQDEENERLLERVLNEPSNENIKKLDDEFKEFYLKIRIISYISSLVYFYTIDFDKRINKRNHRFLLILDKPIGNESGENFNAIIDNLTSPASTENEFYNRKYTFSELIEEEELYQVFNKLTEKQIKVLELIYIHGLKNKEVAEYFNESPQNISNIHKRALNYIRNHYESG